MSANTNIEWTDATWNPVEGCSMAKGSETGGCLNCYAARTALRRPASGLAVMRDSGPRWTGKVQLVEKRLTAPLHWKAPKKIFVNSMSDLFHESLPDETIDRVFAVMALCPQHTFQVLTKRPERMLKYLGALPRPGDDLCESEEDLIERWGSEAGCLLDGEWIWNEGRRFRKRIEHFISASMGLDEDGDMLAEDEILFPLPNVWLGVSVENQETADARIPLLLKTPAAKRFVSYEPALGQVDFTAIRHQLRGDSVETCSVLEGNDGFGQSASRERLDWVIIGGESGPGARPFDINWARQVIEQCAEAGVACFVKQLGPRLLDGTLGFSAKLSSRKGGDISEWPEDLRVRQFPEVHA